MFWGIAGFLVGDLIAWQLAYPALNLDLPWTNFGRLRPLHTSAVIFAFGGNALIATSFYVVQRTSRARLAGRWAPWFVFWGYNLFIVIAATGYILGVTQSKEYAEPEWYADLWLTIVWVIYLLVFLGTLARRKEPHIYVANWFYLAFIVTVVMLHIVNNLAIPVSLTGTKSYIVYSGVQDAMTQWWYSHNAVGFFLTAGFLGMMYYFIPKRAERPVLQAVDRAFLVADLPLYLGRAASSALHRPARLGANPRHDLLHHAVDTLLGGMINGLMTLSDAWDKLRTDPVIRFLVVEGLPGRQFAIRGLDAGAAQIIVAPDDLRTLKVFVTLPREAARDVKDSRTPFSFLVRDMGDGTETRRETIFRGPEK